MHLFPQVITFNGVLIIKEVTKQNIRMYFMQYEYHIRYNTDTFNSRRMQFAMLHTFWNYLTKSRYLCISHNSALIVCNREYDEV